MVGFCGWNMPLKYSNAGIVESHLHTRAHASLFDVSHMGQLFCTGPERNTFMELLTVADMSALATGSATLSLITNQNGGIVDDTIVTNRGDCVYFVVNAGCYDKDMKHIGELLTTFKNRGGKANITPITDRALVAIQGPDSEKVLSQLTDTNLQSIKFMTGKFMTVNKVECFVQRSGYTGEDGFEMSIPAASAKSVVEALLKIPQVKLAGLGARDSLRLEAGLCLYGNDIEMDTTPKEASLVWTIPESRREKGGFTGDKIILSQINNKTPTLKKRIGLVVQGRPGRAGATVHDAESGAEIGKVTSGTIAPSVGKNIAMAYVKPKYSKIGTNLKVSVSAKLYSATVTKMPWITPGYKK